MATAIPNPIPIWARSPAFAGPVIWKAAAGGVDGGLGQTVEGPKSTSMRRRGRGSLPLRELRLRFPVDLGDLASGQDLAQGGSAAGGARRRAERDGATRQRFGRAPRICCGQSVTPWRRRGAEPPRWSRRAEDVVQDPAIGERPHRRCHCAMHFEDALRRSTPRSRGVLPMRWRARVPRSAAWGGAARTEKGRTRASLMSMKPTRM